MSLLVKDIVDIKKYHDIENIIFDLKEFSPEEAVFPKQVFLKKFDRYYFLENQDWFSTSKSYNLLLSFVKANKSHHFYSSVPRYYLLNAIKVSVSNSVKEFVEAQTYANELGSMSEVGLRSSPTVFYYDETKNWAMVEDITNNIIIVGVSENLVDDFKTIFKGLFSDIELYIKKLENFHGAKIDNREEVIKSYS